ncbi:unnamed protein product [Amoebophrya sp. A25]|nr:unnamed protein product [Amoebophrya sp. A25]|eukprot:GSA25T00004621001.1
MPLLTKTASLLCAAALLSGRVAALEAEDFEGLQLVPSIVEQSYTSSSSSTTSGDGKQVVTRSASFAFGPFQDVKSACSACARKVPEDSNELLCMASIGEGGHAFARGTSRNLLKSPSFRATATHENLCLCAAEGHCRAIQKPKEQDQEHEEEDLQDSPSEDKPSSSGAQHLVTKRSRQAGTSSSRKAGSSKLRDWTSDVFAATPFFGQNANGGKSLFPTGDFVHNLQDDSSPLFDVDADSFFGNVGLPSIRMPQIPFLADDEEGFAPSPHFLGADSRRRDDPLVKKSKKKSVVPDESAEEQVIERAGQMSMSSSFGPFTRGPAEACAACMGMGYGEREGVGCFASQKTTSMALAATADVLDTMKNSKQEMCACVKHKDFETCPTTLADVPPRKGKEAAKEAAGGEEESTEMGQSSEENGPDGQQESGAEAVGLMPPSQADQGQNVPPEDVVSSNQYVRRVKKRGRGVAHGDEVMNSPAGAPQQLKDLFGGDQLKDMFGFGDSKGSIWDHPMFGR